MTKKLVMGACALAFLSMLVFGPLSAMAAPPAKTVKDVVDYFYNGQEEGPILTDAKLCKSIKALECETAIDPKAVALGDVINVWMQFFVPKGAAYDDIIVEYKHEGVPRHLSKWSITIKKAMTNLKEFSITVIEK
jgi:hypothetical protein